MPIEKLVGFHEPKHFLFNNKVWYTTTTTPRDTSENPKEKRPFNIPNMIGK